MKINVLQSSADIFIEIKVGLRFISKLSQNPKQPFQTSQKFAGLLMIFRDFLQVMTSILHKSLYRLAKEKGLKRTFRALKVQYLCG